MPSGSAAATGPASGFQAAVLKYIFRGRLPKSAFISVNQRPIYSSGRKNDTDGTLDFEWLLRSRP